MRESSAVDVAINVFAKPYQTALSILSLLKQSKSTIDTIYFQFEPYGSQYDNCSPYIIAEYIHEQAICFQPQQWIALQPVNISKTNDPKYRYAIRYQYAWEHTNKKYLFIMHNDVFFLKDIITDMIKNIGDAIAIGKIGQCWNCPAANHYIMEQLVPKHVPCNPQNYQDFHPTFSDLKKIYDIAIKKNIFVRPYPEGWKENFHNQPWPLPECRVNEWACLINMEQAVPLTIPSGPGFPFGGFQKCGPICLDTGVAWFRSMHQQKKYACHMDIHSYVQHWVGSGKMDKKKYLYAEEHACYLLTKHFPDFVYWCKQKNIHIL